METVSDNKAKILAAVKQITDEPNPLQKFLTFIEIIQEHGIYHRLNCVRDAIMVEIALPGRRWEVEFFADGEIEVEVFTSDGHIGNAEMLEQLLDDGWE
jgi:hypothetical protein